MDNFQIDITAEGKSSLLRAMEIAFAHNAPGKSAKSYRIMNLASVPYAEIPKDLEGKKAFVFRWTEKEPRKEHDDISDFPFNLDAEGAADFAFRWLQEQDFGPQPDHDGHNNKGWRIYTGFWGHVMDERYAICAVIPWWACYGK